jgi:hypothetical protein
LLFKAARTYERNARHRAVVRPVFPYEPDVKIEYTGGLGESGDDLALNRNPVRIDFTIKRPLTVMALSCRPAEESLPWAVSNQSFKPSKKGDSQ